MKNFNKKNKNNSTVSSIKEKTITKKTKQNLKNKKVKEIIKNLNKDTGQNEVSQKKSDKHNKQKKKQVNSKIKKNDLLEEKSTSSKKSKNINGNSKIVNKNNSEDEIKDDDKKIKKIKKKIKIKNPKTKNKNDKKLAALLQLKEMRPRGPRLASLNASCKMQLLYESERERFQINDPITNSDTDVSDSTSDEDEEINKNKNNSIVKKSETNDLLTDDNESSSEKSIEDNQKDKIKDKKIKKSKVVNDKKKVVKEDKKCSTPLDKKSKNQSKLKQNTKKNKNEDKNSQKNKKNSISLDESLSDKESIKITDDKKNLKKKKPDKKEENKMQKKTKKFKNNSKALVKLSSNDEDKKRKFVDESVELIDTKSTKRLASLNASAIMAASYLDEKNILSNQVKNSVVPKNNSNAESYQEKHVEVIQKTTTVINNGVTETIQMFKKVRQVSGKIRDRLLAIKMMENENSDDEISSNNCVVEEIETEDENENLSTKNLGKSVLMKKISATNANNHQASKNKSHTLSSQDLPNQKNSYDNNKTSPSNFNNNRSDTTQVASLTKTTKVKINKKKNNEKTTVEKFKYEVHGAFNALDTNFLHQSVENLRAAAHNNSNPSFEKDDQTNLSDKTNAAAATQFIPLATPLQPNPYGLPPTPGYCIYPNHVISAAAALELAYQQQHINYQQQLQSSFQNPNLSHQAHIYQQAAAIPQIPTMPSHHGNQANVALELSQASSNKHSYKSAFTVPSNSATTSASASKSSNLSSNSLTYTPRVNGIYQLQDNSLVQSINDSSYLVHKPLAFNASSGNSLYSNNPQFYNQPNFQIKQSSKINTFIHPQNHQNILAAQSQPSLISTMQCFPNQISGSPYIFQYPINHNLTPTHSQDLSHLTSLHTSPQFSNSNTFISPSQYAPRQNLQTNPFANNLPGTNIHQPLNITFIAGSGGQTTPFFSPLTATQQIAATAQHPQFFMNNNLNNTLSAVPNLVNTVVVPTGLSSAAVNCNLTLKDFPRPKNSSISQNSSKTSINTINNQNSHSFLLDPNQQNLVNESLLIPNTVNLNSLNRVNNFNNTTTTNSTETKTAIIKIKASKTSSSFNHSDNLIVNNSMSLNNQVAEVKSNVFKNNISKSSSKQKNKTFATGIRKEREKKSICVDDNFNNTLQVKNQQQINSNQFFKPLMNSGHKNFLPKPAPEPELTSNDLSFLENLNADKNKFNNKLSKKDAVTIILDDKEKSNKIVKPKSKNIFKSSNDCLESKIPAKKLRVDLNSYSSSSKQSINFVKNSVTITPISMKAKENNSVKAIQAEPTNCRNKTKNSNSCQIHFKRNLSINLDDVSSLKLLNNLKPLNKNNNDENDVIITDIITKKTDSNSSVVSFKNPFLKKSLKNQLKNNNDNNSDTILTHGWRWEGESFKKSVVVNPDEPNQIRNAYQKIRHIEGDVINVRDCVLLRSGQKVNDVPFVAKISSLWEHPTSKEMMMSLLWYYRPEHTDLVIPKCNNWVNEEILASKHKDVNSVACIDDRCYVLTFNEYCRFKKKQKMIDSKVEKSLNDKIVPASLQKYHRNRKLPSINVPNDMVFFCRKVYDSRQKRILKNPYQYKFL